MFQDAIDAGKVLPPAKNMDDMHTVVTNSTVDGVLSAVLAVLAPAGLIPTREEKEEARDAVGAGSGG